MSKIAYLVSDYHSASHTFIRREVNALRAGGMEITPFSIQSSTGEDESARTVLGHSPLAYIGALFAALFTQPVTLLATWILALSHRPPGLRGLLWSQFHFIEAVTLARMLRKGGYRRLHNHFANSGASVGMLAAKLADIPWSLTLHGISETDFPSGMLLPEKLRHADFVACASYFMRAQAMRVVEPEHWRKMHIVRCGIDLSRLPEASRLPEIAETDNAQGPARLVCVGRLSPEKGYFGLFEALAEMRVNGAQTDGAEFVLTIVGDGPSGDLVRERAAELGLADMITFTGALPERQTLEQIAEAEILVLPSLMEGLPVVLIEALALGKPVVSSQVAGIPELVREGETGLLFAPTDWNSLARQLERMIADTALRQKCAAAGREAIEQEFTIEKAARKLAQLFGC